MLCNSLSAVFVGVLFTQVTDRGQGVWLNVDCGFILYVKSAKKIEKLLGDKRGFIELRKQKGVYVIPPRNSHPTFSHWLSTSQVKGDRWTEVRSKSRRRCRRE